MMRTEPIKVRGTVSVTVLELPQLLQQQCDYYTDRPSHLSERLQCAARRWTISVGPVDTPSSNIASTLQSAVAMSRSAQHLRRLSPYRA